MKMNSFKLFLLAMILPLAFVACEKDDGLDSDNPEVADVALEFRAVTGTQTRAVVSGNFSIDNLLLNVGEIEFDFDDDFFDDDDDRYYDWRRRYGDTYSFDDDLELKGPYVIDLIKDGNLNSVVLPIDLELPGLYYEEIEFDIDESWDRESPLFGLSILLEGEYNGIPFEFASDEDFDFEIEFDSPYIPRDDLGITIDFYIDRFLAHALPRFENIFARAVPDSDGIIKLYYFDDYDDDYRTKYVYNYELAERVWDLFEDFDDIFDYDD